METKKITQEMREQLRAPLDPKAIKPHPTKTYLSSIKTIYQVERLNDVFGVGCWTQKSKLIKEENGMVVVHSELKIPEYGIELESFGGNDNGGEKSKGFDLGDAYKGACTDALSKMCSFLEIAIDVYKGLSDPGKQPQANRQPAQPSTNANDPQKLSPDSDNWNTVIGGLKVKEVQKDKWEEIKRKKNFIITPEHEKILFGLVGWN